MPIIQGQTSVAPKTASAWVATDDIANIAVGIVGKGGKIQFNLGGTDVYDIDPVNINNDGAVVAKAFEVRVINTGDKVITFEVFS